jgi:hypothetical protein
MLELRLLPDAKRIVALRASIAQECSRSKVDADHTELVASITEQLILGAAAPAAKRGRRAEVFVVVTVQSDSTMLMVRDTKPLSAELDEFRQALLDERTASWSTISGTEGRTIWAEIPRARTAETAPAPPVAAKPTPAPERTTEPAPTAEVPAPRRAPIPA